MTHRTPFLQPGHAPTPFAAFLSFTVMVVFAREPAHANVQGSLGSSLPATTLLMLLCFAALGADNGALFQLVPLRWPASTMVASSMIGEVGALGGGLQPAHAA